MPKYICDKCKNEYEANMFRIKILDWRLMHQGVQKMNYL